VKCIHSFTYLTISASLSFVECDGRSCPGNSTIYLAVCLLVHRLSTELAEASHSLLIAAASGPMYGALFCIRQLLSDVSFM
jgi:hypothetical protein